MPTVPRPENEPERLAALHALSLLDTPPDPAFGIFPEVARSLFDTPIAAISLVDTERQWFKSIVGFDVTETPRDQSFCAHAILRPDHLLIVPDASADPRFANNPFVTGEPGIRFYAGAPIVDRDGHALGALCVIDRVPRDVAPGFLAQLANLARGVGSTVQLHSAVRQLRAMALTDFLTGIANRAGLDAGLAQRLAQRAPGRRLGVLCLDLDSFKAINDLFGHAGGDAALREVAARLRRSLRGGDLVARLGGDEFCVVMHDVADPEAPAALAARIHAALADSFMIGGKPVPLRTSIGIAIAPDDATTPEALLALADAALYVAKRSGAGSTRATTAPRPAAPQDPDPTAGVPGGRAGIHRMLEHALLPPGREPFSLRFQPYFTAQDQRLLGFEALVRWPRPDGSELLPGGFIPIAEATGLVVQLDHWVLTAACREAAGWAVPLDIAANLSAANFFAASIVDDVAAILDRTGLPARRLKLEITESVLLRDPDRVRAAIKGLRRLGVRIAIDDFGAGHASLAYLRDYPIDEIKIDRGFVQTADTDPRIRAFLQAIIDMGAALDVGTVAEGVETMAQLHLVQARGVGVVQGYLLGRPVSAAEARTRMLAPRAA